MNGQGKNLVKRKTYRVKKKEKEEIIKRFQNGETMNSIAREMGRTPRTVKMICKNLPSYKPREYINWSKYDDVVIAMRKEGKGVVQISRELNLDRGSLAYRFYTLKQRGLISNDFRRR